MYILIAIFVEGYSTAVSDELIKSWLSNEDIKWNAIKNGKVIKSSVCD